MKLAIPLLVFFITSSTFMATAQDVITAKALALELIKEARVIDASVNKDSVKIPEARALQYHVSRFSQILANSLYEPDSLYKEALLNDLAIMQSINKEGYDASKLELLTYLAEQFSIRAEYSSGWSIDLNPYGLINVTVEVLQNDKHVRRCEISCSTYFWKTDKAFVANNDGSPTTMKLPPGKYIFRVHMNAKEIKSTVKQIGEAKGEINCNVKIEL
jgi:hypothetical protein